jgi:two-component system response regulator NreC
MIKRLLQAHLERLKKTGGSGQPAITPREREILRLLAEGYSNTEIAEQLFISPSTVHSHRTNLMQKLNVNSRHDLGQYARQHGLLHDF